MSVRRQRSLSSLKSQSSRELLSSSQLLTVPEPQHLSVNNSRKSSASSSTSSFQGRHGGLRRRRLSVRKMTVLRDPGLKPIEKLKRFLRSVRIIVEVCLALKRYVNKSKLQEPLTLMEMKIRIQEDLNKRLTFNPHYYRASYVANKGSSKLKKLLAISPAARSKRNVKMIHTLVENKSAFSKHPVHIRMKMCQVMIYQSYDARRVIIKQGHPPSAFYIILSGTCLINARESDSEGAETNQTVNELHEGEIFGEVALLNKSVRTASVVCKSNVELLVIYKEDFDAIIRGPLYKQREEVLEYCKKIPILVDWPVQFLSSASVVNFHFQYQRKGTIVIKNNMKSNFLVFIKSGECRIVCTLDGGEEQNSSQHHTYLRHKSVAATTRFPLLDQVSKQQVIRPRSLSLSFYPRKIISTSFTGLLPAIIDDAAFAEDKEQNIITTSAYSTRRGKFPQAVKPRSSLFAPPMRSIKEHVEMYDTFPQPTPVTYGSQRLQVLHQTARPSVIEDTPYTIVRKNKSLIKLEQKRKTAKALSTGSIESYEDVKSSKSKPLSKAKFVQIAVLKSGCVFGLEEMMKRTQLRLSLISDGAECIFISKKIFQRHAGPRTLRCLNSMIGRYPTEEYIRLQLAEQTEWCNFRKDVMKDVLERQEEKSQLPVFMKVI